MSILVDETTRVVCQGVTGRAGAFHTRQCIDYGTNFVAGVTPGKGGMEAEGLPVYDSVKESVAKHDANTSMIFVPPFAAADAIEEAAAAGIKLIVCITEHIPQIDMIRATETVSHYGARLIGPNCPGLTTSEVCKIGILPGYIHKKGNVGIVSRSGTLTYEAIWQTTLLDLGQSSCVGIGGDPIHGIGFIECLELFEQDDQTEGIIMIGEIGGSDEEAAADWIKANGTKPVVSFIAGQTAPPGRRMGHAGAIISGSSGTAAGKVVALEAAGVTCCKSPSDMGQRMHDVLNS